MKPKLTRWRFGTKTLFVVVLVAAFFFGWIVHLMERGEAQQRAVDWLSLHGMKAMEAMSISEDGVTGMITMTVRNNGPTGSPLRLFLKDENLRQYSTLIIRGPVDASVREIEEQLNYLPWLKTVFILPDSLSDDAAIELREKFPLLEFKPN